MDPGPLLDGESVMYSGRVNALISPSEHGLSQFAADQLLDRIGAEGQEAIGGKLFVTQARIIFSSHRLNRLSGRLSTPLSVVDSYQRFKSGLLRGLEVRTQAANQSYVSWSAGKAIRTLEEAKAWAREHPAEAEAWDKQLVNLLGGWEINQTAEALNLAAKEWLNVSPLTQLSAVMTRLPRSRVN